MVTAATVSRRLSVCLRCVLTVCLWCVCSNQFHEGALPWEDLQELLGSNGDKVDKADLQTYLSALLGDAEATIHPHDLIDGSYFASRFLGFEEA